MAVPRTVPVMSAASVPADPAPVNRDPCYGAQRYIVTLDAPDVALTDQRLLAYRERLRREEAEVEVAEPGHAHHPARPRPPVGRTPTI